MTPEEAIQKVYNDAASAALEDKETKDVFHHIRYTGGMEAAAWIAKLLGLEIDTAVMDRNKEFFLEWHKRINDMKIEE